MKLASLFIENEQDKQFFLNQSRTEQIEKEKPLLYFAKDQKDEFNKLIDLINTRLFKNERVGIFLPTNRYVAYFAKKLVNNGIDVEWKVFQHNDASYQYDFNSTKPKILTFHSAKGLTFDSVIIPKLSDNAFPLVLANEINRLVFVGITRAQKWVGLISSLSKPLNIIAGLRNIGTEDFLTIKTSEEKVSSQITQKDQDDNGLLDFL